MLQKVEDIEAVKATVQKYIDGIAQSNTDLISEAFHPQATMSGHFRGEFSIRPAAESIVAYMRKSKPTSETSPDFKGAIASISVYGTIAAATITEQGLEGANFLTYFHLHKVDDAWRITNKATYAEAAG